MKKIDKNNETFEDIKHIDENGVEFWYAREIMEVLQYRKWQNFEKIIDKAKISCENSDISVFEHFTDVSKTIKMPKGAEKTILDYKLTRYACYLIAQNGDSRKKVIILLTELLKMRVLKILIDFIIQDIKDYIRSTTNKDNYWYVLYYFKIVQIKLFSFF